MTFCDFFFSAYGMGDEMIGVTSSPQVVANMMAAVPSPLEDSSLPIHVELPSDLAHNTRTLDFTFPFKHVVKGFVIDTDVTKYLRSDIHHGALRE